MLTASCFMEKPLVTVLASTGPRTALRTMREHQTSAAFVVGRDRKLVGRVRAARIADAVQENVQKLDGLIDPEDLEPVPPDTPVADLFTRCAESDLPVPVADEDGTLLGVIPRVTLLAALGAINSHEVVEAEPELALAKEGGDGE